MRRNPGESPWLTCNCLTPLALVFSSQHSHNINIEHTSFIQRTQGPQYLEILLSIVVIPTQ